MIQNTMAMTIQDRTDAEEEASHAYDLDDNLILSLKARLTALGLHVPTPPPRATPLPPTTLLPHSSPYSNPNPTNSPYLHNLQSPGHVTLHQSPYSLSAPNLPLPAQPQTSGYSLVPDSSSSAAAASPYVMPFVSDASMYNSPYVPSVQAPSPYINAHNNTPVPSLYAPSPYINVSGTGTGGGVPLPAASAYTMSPYVDYADPALYPASSYSSPYAVPLQAPTPY
ncbi:hypothetical protein BT96DRAFT_429602 [Gymnopus androsaceus JB14]|uniref:Uncharacterized protein n=1 Tax=Gymnopus androsaceus JB14 TaxID=1447944 RepID=A0A6A4GS74_9AGAR|nr:hypothetical protein BT96DRAFT_429602 [Gymnopus androsaceus JB14]